MNLMLEDIHRLFVQDLHPSASVASPSTPNDNLQSYFTFSIYATLSVNSKRTLLCSRASFALGWLDEITKPNGTGIFKCHCIPELAGGTGMESGHNDELEYHCMLKFFSLCPFPNMADHQRSDQMESDCSDGGAKKSMADVLCFEQSHIACSNRFISIQYVSAAVLHEQCL
jgi:hypothetical protein